MTERIALGDTLEGRAFVNRCVAAAADLSLFFTGEPDEKVHAALHKLRANIEADLAGELGPDVGAAIAEAFVAAVIGGKREIEAAGETPRR